MTANGNKYGNDISAPPHYSFFYRVVAAISRTLFHPPNMKSPQGNSLQATALCPGSTTLFSLDRPRPGLGSLFDCGFFDRFRRGFPHYHFVDNHLITFAGVVNRHRQTRFYGLDGDRITHIVNIGCALCGVVVHRR